MEVRSPGGFVFGIQGWHYGEVRPVSITFFMDNTTRVSDHHGNAIPEFRGTHQEVIANLRASGIDWQKLETAGWPQLPYVELKAMVKVPATPADELAKIKNKELRQAALQLRKEADAAALAESEAA